MHATGERLLQDFLGTHNLMRSQCYLCNILILQWFFFFFTWTHSDWHETFSTIILLVSLVIFYGMLKQLVVFFCQILFYFFLSVKPCIKTRGNQCVPRNTVIIIDQFI